jgi:actin-related protein
MSEKISVPVVIDIGSENCRSGFAGENFPKSELQSIVGSQNMLIYLKITRNATLEMMFIQSVVSMF